MDKPGRHALPVRWIRKGDDIDCEAWDISVDGMFLRTNEDVQVGELLQLAITLHNRCRLRMFVAAAFIGETTSGRGIGVEIHIMDDMERLVWEDYHRSLAVRDEDDSLGLVWCESVDGLEELRAAHVGDGASTAMTP